MAERKTLLIPSLLDDWFPLLQYAFTSEEWEPVLLTEDDPHLAELGLKYFHNELCYPVFLVAGQVLSALRSGRYDPARCGVLFGQAGDECRGSCGIRLLRRVLDRLGYGRVETLSLNVRGIDRGTGLPITAAMVRRCLAAAVWGDTLALLRNQTRPYEAVPGTAEALWRRWTEDLGQDWRGIEDSPAGRSCAAAGRWRPNSGRWSGCPVKSRRWLSWGRFTRNTATWATGIWSGIWRRSTARSAWAASPGTPCTTWTATP
ncbi:hypothetical protein [Dysosmobacter welbionis]|uniref:hypothetical protein n=1 Tax=Dysosmobacter welbionis TaxID=2093857 RepID=UPI00300E95F7